MAGLFSVGKRRFGERRYRVIIEVSYAGGRLADELRRMLAAQISVPGARTGQDIIVGVSPERAGVLIVSASVSAARPLAALSMVDEALNRALMTTGLFEGFDVTGKMLRVAPSQR
jgi:hypothetical protein